MGLGHYPNIIQNKLIKLMFVRDEHICIHKRTTCLGFVGAAGMHGFRICIYGLVLIYLYFGNVFVFYTFFNIVCTCPALTLYLNVIEGIFFLMKSVLMSLNPS